MRIARSALALLWLVSVAAPASASEKTFEGTLVCAKCTLKKPDASACQDVLLVPDATGAKAEYYITKNDVARASGEVCTNRVKATVTGTVAAKDGKTWLTPSKIKKQPSQ